MRVYHDTYWQTIADEWWDYYDAGQQVWAPYRFLDKYGRKLYIGHSNAPHLRHDQHRLQLWWGQYLNGGSWEVYPARFDNEAESDAYETYLIHRERPLYNIRKNEGNPDRIIPAQRARLAARSRPVPVFGRPRGGVSGPLVAVGVLVVVGLGWSALSSLGGTCLFGLAVAAMLGWAALRRR